MINIFAKEKVNNGRQHEVDYSRGLTALILIICHVGLYLGNASDKFLYCFSDIIGSEWGAPVFMALMGLCMVYSKNQTPKSMLKRGISLFIGGYILSLFRTIFPLLIFGNIDEWTQIDSYFVIDILQFAGLTFMFMALLKKIKIPSWGILIISIVMVGIGQVMMTFVCPMIDNVYASYFVNLFFPVTEWSCFSFFTWFFFPAFGFCFGELLIRCKNKNRFYAILLPISFLGVMVVYLHFHFMYPNYTNYYFGGNFYYMGIGNVIMTALFICFSLSFCYFIGKILPNFIKKYLYFLSKNLNKFYVVSWIVISFIIHMQAYCSISFSSLEIFILFLLVTIICSVITFCFVSIKKAVNNKKSIQDTQSGLGK